MTPQTYGNLIFDKEGKNYTRKKEASSTSSAGLTGCLHAEECKQILIYDPAQNKSNWTEDLNIKPDT